jgi:ribosomal protein S12 methylthiotransferase
VLPYLDVPQHRHPDVLSVANGRPAAKSERTLAGVNLPEIVIQHIHRWFSWNCELKLVALTRLHAGGKIDRAGCFAYSAVERATAMTFLACCRLNCAKSVAPGHGLPKLFQPAVGTLSALRCRCWLTMHRHWALSGIGRSHADALREISWLLPPEKISKTMKVGEFTKARIAGYSGHDL